MSEYDTDMAKKQPEHVVGQQLDTLSLHEIDERIHLLLAEIERLKVTRTKKAASHEIAAAIFKL